MATVIDKQVATVLANADTFFTLFTFSPPTNSITEIKVSLVATTLTQDSTSGGARFNWTTGVRRSHGAPILFGYYAATDEDAYGLFTVEGDETNTYLNAYPEISGNDVLIKVYGLASPAIQWSGVLETITMTYTPV